MFLKIDNREKELINKICFNISIIPLFKNIKMVIENLPIGDIIICNDNNEEIIIIERKSINDLLSSIKDGRYEEQSFRLNGNWLHNHNIIYLIEGLDIKNNIEKQTLYSAMFSLNYYKGFSVIRTFSLDETAFFICNSLIKLTKSKKIPFYLYSSINETIPNETIPNETITNETITNETIPNEIIPNETNNNKEYVSFVKKNKKENITKENIDELMLCQIPGISNITSIALIKHFKSLYHLIEIINTNPDLLKDITYTNNDQTRKISKQVIQNLHTFLLK